MKTTDNATEIKNRAILVTLAISNTRNKEHIENIDAATLELANLAEAAEVEVLGNILQNKDAVDVTYFIGKGKVEEIKDFAQSMDANLIIFNHELSGSQLRNLEDEIQIDIIDRTTLILEIFARRATTKEGKLQVELAQLNYRLPRLVGMGIQMSRTGAGIGTRGPGEKKLETDRRHIKSRIFEIEKELKDIEKNRGVQRAQRIKSSLPIVALVGYTNAGKSTIMNEIIKLNPEHSEDKEVFEKDMLFATLDTSLRKATMKNGNEFLLTDTVGFVSRLPHSLINAFKSTLEEVIFSDLILHVVDASSEEALSQMQAVNKVLQELNCHEKKTILVLNKCDVASEEQLLNIHEQYPDLPCIEISAKQEKNIDGLLEALKEALPQQTKICSYLIPYQESAMVAYLHRNAIIQEERYEDQGTFIQAIVNLEVENYCKKYQEKL